MSANGCEWKRKLPQSDLKPSKGGEKIKRNYLGFFFCGIQKSVLKIGVKLRRSLSDPNTRVILQIKKQLNTHTGHLAPSK